MQLTCPQCGQSVRADHINIQQMAAVCPTCSNVFQFAADGPKLKRRKVRQPRHLQLDESEGLHIAYRTNFRLEKNENFLNAVAMSVFFTFLTLLMAGLYFAGELPLFLPILIGLVALPMYYWLGLIAFNKTHIDMDGVSIKVSRQPLPGGQTREIDLSGLLSVSAEETRASKQKEYDTPRYHVWAHFPGGGRKLIVADVTEEYGYFTAQTLDGYLQQDASRLALDEGGEGAEGLLIDEEAYRDQDHHR